MTARIIVGDCLEQLRTLGGESVHCVVTSPPYWGLRDYGDERQLGLEAAPCLYVERLVEVFREVRRVLRRDGTLWLNLGDSYTDSGRGNDTGSSLQGTRNNQRESRRSTVRESSVTGLRPKNLIGAPWQVAFALQADGWYLRSDIVWHKPNAMPESVTDRPTRAHEYLFLLAKSGRYYYDAEAIKEPQSGHERQRRLREQREGLDRTYDLARDALTTQSKPGATGAARSLSARHRLAVLGTRNKRSVWTVSTRAFTGGHFATFPPTLITPCILAGTSPRCCELCGAPWQAVYSAPVATGGPGSGNKERSHRHQRGGPASNTKRQAHSATRAPSARQIVDWVRSCRCELAQGTARSVVLDPFAGAGTTGLVAERHGRDSVLIELNPEYAEMAQQRIADDVEKPGKRRKIPVEIGAESGTNGGQLLRNSTHGVAQQEVGD